MRDLNVFSATARLGKDPEIRFLSDGKAVCSVSVAIQRDDKTTWLRVSAFDKTAEAMGKYLHKGSKVGITGYLKENSWQDKQGNKKTTLELICNQVVFLDPKKTEDAPF